jgi:hypothetical protein
MRLSRFVRGLLFFSSILSIAAAAADTKEQPPQQQRADAPVLGYAFGDASRDLRAILGVPGSSRWSDPIALPEGVASLKVANGHRWALAFSASGSVAGVLSLETFQLSSLTGGSARVDAVVFSPAGRSMAVRRGGVVSVYTGLPEAATVSLTWEVAEGFSLDSIAVSDSGEAAILHDGSIVRITTSERIASCLSNECRIAFFPNSSGLAMLDGGRLLELQGGEQRVIAEGIKRQQMPQIAAASARIALASPGKLVVYERASGAIALEETLSEDADRFEATRIQGVYLFAAPEDRAAWLYSDEGIRFVPAAAGARSKEQQ